MSALLRMQRYNETTTATTCISTNAYHKTVCKDRHKNWILCYYSVTFRIFYISNLKIPSPLGLDCRFCESDWCQTELFTISRIFLMGRSLAGQASIGTSPRYKKCPYDILTPLTAIWKLKIESRIDKNYCFFLLYPVCPVYRPVKVTPFFSAQLSSSSNWSMTVLNL